jgi:hypothetical protein
MAQDIGLLLRGLGASFSQQVPQFRQEMAQEQELARQQQLLSEQQSQRQRQAQIQDVELQQKVRAAGYQDAFALGNLLKGNNIEAGLGLLEDRLNTIEQLGINLSGDPTMMIYEDLKLAATGDAEALRRAQMRTALAVAEGIDRGELQLPETAKGVVVDRRLVNPATGEVMYEPPAEAAAQAQDEYSPGITRYRNGVAVQYSRQGNVRVVDEQGRAVSGPDAQAAIQRGIDSGIAEAGQVAISQAQGKGASERAQGIINAGVDAISQFPVITRTLDLLKEAKTGGFAGAGIRARSLFGVEGADEGELSYNLSMNVLQQLKPIFGSAFTAGEGQRLERIEASIGRNTDTNIRLLNQALSVAKTSAEKALDRAEEANDSSTVRELSNAISMLDSWSSGELTMPAEWTQMGGTKEAWDRLPDADKREFIGGK